MDKNDIDWKRFAKKLLWRNIVYSPDEKSGYHQVDVDGYEERGYPKGSVEQGLSFQSWIHPNCYHELTWKELGDVLAIDFHEF